MNEETKLSSRSGERAVLAVLVGIVLVMLALYLGASTRNRFREYSYIGRPDAARDTITISGEGKVTVVPDVAIVMAGLETEKPDVASALKENTDRMNSFTAALKRDLGIDAKDIQTANYSLNAVYDYTNNRTVLRGYQVSQQVRIKVRDLSKAGQALASVGQYNLNTVGGLTFIVDDPESAKQQARLQALEQAREKAKALSTAAGARLGKIVSFSESSGGGAPPPPLYYERMAATDSAGAPVPNVEPGSSEITATVVVSYELL